MRMGVWAASGGGARHGVHRPRIMRKRTERTGGSLRRRVVADKSSIFSILRETLALHVGDRRSGGDAQDEGAGFVLVSRVYEDAQRAVIGRRVDDARVAAVAAVVVLEDLVPGAMREDEVGVE